MKLAINGFGRIGRNVARLLLSESNKSPLEIVAVNDLTDTKTLSHLFKYDSVHGTFKGTVSADQNTITINGHEIRIYAEKDPAKLPWKELGVDVVLECTGLFTKAEKASLHIQSGAKKVLISAPSPDPDITIAYGVNHAAYDAAKHNIVSCASCTTNCLAPVAKVLVENFGIVRGTMTTIHSYTNDQQILDLPHKDLRRARAAALSMIPTTTGAAKAVGLVIPSLKGKVDGYAIRVPTCDVSVVDFVVELEREGTAEDINRAMKSASENSLKGILGYSDEPLVSVDYIGCQNSSTLDSLLTMVIDKKLAKVVAWYDNEMGFSARMIDVATMMAKVVGRKLVIGNWKMNLLARDAASLATKCRLFGDSLTNCELWLAPSFTALPFVSHALSESAVQLGAQNVCGAPLGAFTGEISASMLKEFGVTFAIIGHSERRHTFHESNEVVATRVIGALAADIIPVFCIGETAEQYDADSTKEVLQQQVDAVFTKIDRAQIARTIIAYEPCWAIGTGKVATPETIAGIHSFIFTLCTERYGAVPRAILYGGSVTPENFAEILQQPHVDGGLVGGASLKESALKELVSIADRS